MSTGYMFYLLEGEHIADLKVCDCTKDADALLEAGAFLQASEYFSVEVWNGPRRVAMLSKPATQ